MHRVKLPLFVLIFSVFLFAQNWEIVKEGNMEFAPNDGFTFNMDTAMYVGQDGAVMITTDGGENGMLVREPDGNSWKNVDFANDTVGYACAGDGYIYKTTDGGYHWTQVGDIVNYTNDLLFLDVVSEDTVFVAGKSSTLLKTVDGGITWEKSDFSFGQDLDGGIAFCNSRVGVVASDKKGGYSWYTHDGGATWTLSQVSFPQGTLISDIEASAAAGDSTFILAGWHYCIFISTDGGKTYKNSGDYSTSFTNTQYYSIETLDENTFIVGGQKGHIVKTLDGGNTWTEIDLPCGETVIFIDFVNANEGYVFATNGQWFKTFDGGQNWIPLLEWPNTNFHSIGLPSDNSVLIGGWRGQLSISYNGGTSFSYPLNSLTGSVLHLNVIKFIDDKNGLIGAGGGELYRTTDGGNTWTMLDTSANPMYKDGKSIYAIDNLDNNTVIAGGSSGKIMISHDGGNTWTYIPNSEKKSIEDIYFLSDSQVLAAAQSGHMYISTSSLDSFYLANDYGGMKLKGIDFKGDIGLVVGDKGEIFRTTVAEWDTLEQVFSEPDGDGFNDVVFINDSTAYAVGYGGKIYKSTDYGLNWIAETSDIEEILWKVNYRNGKLWAVGNSGYILSKIVSTPTPISDLYINEFMASNDNALADENGDYDDWIEFYNGSDQNIDMGGMLITDDLSDPFSKWYAIPDTAPDITTVEPGGFILFWADKESEEGVLHLEIKLSGKGEQIGLAQIVGADTVILDSLSFGPQEADTSMGRRTDGADEWVKFYPSTPLDKNENGTIVSIRRDPNAIVHKYALEQNYPNPFNPSTTIKFSLKKAGKVELVVYNAAGQKVATLVNENMKAGRVEVKWNAGKLASGLYFYRLKSGNFTAVKKMLLIK